MNSQNVTIRCITDDDCVAVYKLHIKSIAHDCADHYSKDSLKAWIDSKAPANYRALGPENYILIAIQENEILGFGLISCNKKSIDSLYVDPEHTGKGVGKILLNDLEKIAKEHGIDEITLSSTLNAIGFYSHMGYKEVRKGIHRLASGHVLDCVMMIKKLNTSVA